MKYFRRIIYYALLFMRLNVSSSNVYQKIDVNDFLKKVMLSERFDEIADKIADKAAKKIRDMKNFEMLPVPHSDGKGEAAYRVSEFEQINTLNSTTKELSLKSTISDRDSVPKSTVSKVDTIGIFKKEVLNPIKGLSLKFRDFTTKTHFDNQVDVKEEDVDISKNNLSYEEKTRVKMMEPMASIIKDIQPDNEQDRKPRANSQSEEIVDDNLTALNEKSLEYNAEYSKEDQVKQVTLEQKDNNTQQLPATEIESHSESGETPLADSAEPDVSNLGTESKHIAKTERQPKTKIEHLSSPVPDEDSPSEEYYEVNSQDQSKTNTAQSSMRATTQSHKIKSKKKAVTKLTRKEGGKIYTFESSPDYAEYQQEIRTLQKNN